MPMPGRLDLAVTPFLAQNLTQQAQMIIALLLSWNTGLMVEFGQLGRPWPV
jgi:hypothetical protein